MCSFERSSERSICADGWQGDEKLNLDGEISACIRACVRDVRAFEVGDPAAR